MAVLDTENYNYQCFNMKGSGLYIHIPFCKNKCIYCDFFSGGASFADWDSYVDSLLLELKGRILELPIVPDTLYIGGGTPSLIPSELFMKLISGINDVLEKNEPWLEFTVEVNPDDVSDDKCRVWKESGVNRVSMGVQSFVDSELSKIRRRHTSEDALRAYDLLACNFDNISIDLMFGLPEQTCASWIKSVKKALDLSPDHISAYSLMFEDGTPISVLKKQGKMKFPSDEESVEMWKILSSQLKEAGYNQYELSNYSKPGRESIHNTRYWLGNPYLGLGPSAHSYDGKRIRRANPADIKGYLRHFTNNDVTSHFYAEEILTVEEQKDEMLLTRMRMRRGLDIVEYESNFGKSAKQRLLNNAKPFLINETLINDSNRLKLSDDGIMIADDIILALSM